MSQMRQTRCRFGGISLYGSEEGKVMSIKDFTEDELNIVYSSFIFRGMSKIEISAALSRCAVLQFCRDEIIRDETSFEKSLGIVVSDAAGR